MKRQKIVFISLPAPYLDEPAMNPPLGICYVAAYLREKGFEDIRLVDFCLHKSYDYYDSKEYLGEIPLDADVYGVSAMTPQYRWLKEVCHYLKRERPDSLLVTGGPHSSNCVKDCLFDCRADYAIVGRGEIAMCEVVSGKKKSLEEVECEWLAGSFPAPYRDLTDMGLYKRTINGRKAAHLVTLRGCPFDCAFCDRQSVGRRVYYRPVSDVMKEVDFLIEDYRINAFVIYDDIFTLQERRVREFCDEFRERGSIWRCWSRTDTVNKEMLSYMKESGLTSIIYGVESGDDRVLSRINKQSTREQNRQALLWTKEVGIPVQCSLMYGNPGENIDSIDNTIELVRETQPDEWFLSLLTPIPGSAIWDRPEDFGVSFDKDWVKREDYAPCSRTGGKSGIGDIWIALDTMTRDELISGLKYFVAELERVCPRRKIRDTFQDFYVDEVSTKVEGG